MNTNPISNHLVLVPDIFAQALDLEGAAREAAGGTAHRDRGAQAGGPRQRAHPEAQSARSAFSYRRHRPARPSP